MTARRERRAPTQAEAEAWRKCQAQAERKIRMMAFALSQHGVDPAVVAALDTAADAIARMEPEGKG